MLKQGIGSHFGHHVRLCCSRHYDSHIQVVSYLWEFFFFFGVNIEDCCVNYGTITFQHVMWFYMEKATPQREIVLSCPKQKTFKDTITRHLTAKWCEQRNLKGENVVTAILLSHVTVTPDFFIAKPTKKFHWKCVAFLTWTYIAHAFRLPRDKHKAMITNADCAKWFITPNPEVR